MEKKLMYSSSSCSMFVEEKAGWYEARKGVVVFAVGVVVVVGLVLEEEEKKVDV